MVTNYTQWRVPTEDVGTKLNYSQLPLPNEQYNISQPPPVLQRHGYPVVDSHPQLNYYSPNPTSNLGSWSNERDSGQGQYWQHRH